MKKIILIIIATIISISFSYSKNKISNDEVKYLAENGNEIAQLLLGTNYFDGINGFPKDKKKGMYWIKKSAEKGSIEAEVVLCKIYFRNKESYKKLFKYCEKSANKGHKVTQYYLAILYGAGKNYEKATYWLKKSAEQGYSDAQYAIAFTYKNGAKGVLKSYKKAVYYFKESAKQGHPEAQYNLAAHYVAGYGVKSDLKLAYMWFNVASYNGNKESKKEIKKMEKMKFLSSSDIDEAQDMSSACISSNYKRCGY